MINLEVWLTADSDLKSIQHYDNVIDYGVVSPPGRFSWMIPKVLGNVMTQFDVLSTNKSDDILWTFFQHENFVHIFDIDDPDDLKLIKDNALVINSSM